MSSDNLLLESKLIMITFYPKFINKIRSYHILSLQEYNNLIDIINDESFFIENFFRTSKNSYEYICSDNMEITVLDNTNKKIVIEYLDLFNNDFDIYDMIISNIKIDSD